MERPPRPADRIGCRPIAWLEWDREQTSLQAKASIWDRSHWSSRARLGCSLHQVLHDIFADLTPHAGSNAGREPIMETSPDAGIRNLVGKFTEIGPAVGNARRRRARHRYFGDFH